MVGVKLVTFLLIMFEGKNLPFLTGKKKILVNCGFLRRSVDSGLVPVFFVGFFAWHFYEFMFSFDLTLKFL